MKTKNTKKDITAAPKTAPAKKKTPGKGSPPHSSAKKKIKSAVKTSAKSLEKEKKTSALKKTSKKPYKAKKDLKALTLKAAKKGSSKKSLKPAQIKTEKIKKKVAKPEPLSKKVRKKSPKGALKKVPSSAKKISSPTGKKAVKIIEKVKAPVTKKPIGTVIKPSPAKKPLKAAKPKTGPEEEKTRIPKRKEVLVKVIKEIQKAETSVTKQTKSPSIKPPAVKPLKTAKPEAGPETNKVLVPKTKEVLKQVSAIELPDEYGEDEIILIAVDPNMVFVDWEIRKEEARRARDGFTMRVFNVPDRETPRAEREGLVDIKIKGRVGRAFFELGTPGRKVAIEIGYYENGKFLPVLRSSAVSLPRLLTYDELGIALKMFESGIPVGY